MHPASKRARPKYSSSAAPRSSPPQSPPAPLSAPPVGRPPPRLALRPAARAAAASRWPVALRPSRRRKRQTALRVMTGSSRRRRVSVSSFACIEAAHPSALSISVYGSPPAASPASAPPPPSAPPRGMRGAEEGGEGGKERRDGSEECTPATSQRPSAVSDAASSTAPKCRRAPCCEYAAAMLYTAAANVPSRRSGWIIRAKRASATRCGTSDAETSSTAFCAPPSRTEREVARSAAVCLRERRSFCEMASRSALRRASRW
mmetsp:Transcript_43506/g.144907  ORF Transcript_43506/g.144907 Transcript_43506/m.144907 type:complete len:261 (+) Transcript_43506:419-1201(+)